MWSPEAAAAEAATTSEIETAKGPDDQLQPMSLAPADAIGPMIVACICTGLLGLIGHRLRRRCR